MKNTMIAVALIMGSCVALAGNGQVGSVGILSTECDPTGKYFEAYGGKYDSSILNEFYKSYSCRPATGGMGGFALNVAGCKVKNVRLYIDKYIPGVGYDGYYMDLEIPGKSWAKVTGGTGKLKVNAGSDALEIQGEGSEYQMEITRTVNGSSEVLECRAIEGDG